GGGVAVVLEELGRIPAVVSQVEAPVVEGRRLLVPGPLDQRHDPGRYAEPGEEVAVDDGLSGLPAEPLQLRRRGLDLVDLAGREAVVGGFVPVGPAVRGVPDQAEA